MNQHTSAIHEARPSRAGDHRHPPPPPGRRLRARSAHCLFFPQAATMSSQLVWELVKNNNAFLRKSVNHTVFSAEPGNL